MTELETNKTSPEKSKKRKRIHHNDFQPKMKKSYEIGGQFTLIKNVVPLKVAKIERVLPDWLSNPVPIKKNLKDKLKSPKEVCHSLHPDLLKCLRVNNIIKFFPVQQVVIPYILSSVHGVENRFPPRDICVATPTGSGKTLAFVVPIVQALGKRTLHSLSAVVILPVIELAKQVYSVFNTYASVFKLSVGKALGGENFQVEQDQLVQKVYDTYYSKVDILVATPGRLFDHINKTPGLDFTQLRFLVLDEADKLLTGENGELISRILSYTTQFKHSTVNLGFPPFFPLEGKVKTEISSHHKEERSISLSNEKKENILFFSSVKNVTNLEEEKKLEYFDVPRPPVQRLLFSATLTHDPEQLQNVSLFRPILFIADTGESEGRVKATADEMMKPSELTEEWVNTELSLKPLVLHYILRKERKKADNFRCLVFAGSIELTTKLTILLKSLSKGKYVVEEFSSKFAKERKTKISKFMKGNIHVLVASDAMARGVDVPDIDCVISYDVPSIITYTHRVGRTARAGKPGKAISILTEDELKNFKKLLGKNFANVTERSVDQEKLTKFESSFKNAVESLAEAVKTGNETGKIKKTLKRKRKFFKTKLQ